MGWTHDARETWSDSINKHTIRKRSRRHLAIVPYILKNHPLRNQIHVGRRMIQLTLFLGGARMMQNIRPHSAHYYSTTSVQNEWQLHHPRGSHIPPSGIRLPESSEQTFPAKVQVWSAKIQFQSRTHPSSSLTSNPAQTLCLFREVPINLA